MRAPLEVLCCGTAFTERQRHRQVRPSAALMANPTSRPKVLHARTHTLRPPCKFGPGVRCGAPLRCARAPLQPGVSLAWQPIQEREAPDFRLGGVRCVPQRVAPPRRKWPPLPHGVEDQSPRLRAPGFTAAHYAGPVMGVCYARQSSAVLSPAHPLVLAFDLPRCSAGEAAFVVEGLNYFLILNLYLLTYLY